MIRMITRRRLLRVIGLLLIVAAFALPEGWDTPLPSPEPLPAPPIRGALLFQISLVIQGIVLVALSFRRSLFTRLPAEDRLWIAALPAEARLREVTAGAGLPAVARLREATAGEGWWLVAITGLALALRLWRLNGELWLDEVNARLLYRDASILQVLVTYLTSNNQLLYTILVKLFVAMFGEHEWVLRLPAATFGVATIPAVYWGARLAMSRWASLSVASLLAVSYHHIFFSQNARAYTAYLFFSLVASVALVKGLAEDRLKYWVLYVISMVLAFSATLIAGFVFASHLFVGLVALVMVARRGRRPRHLAARLAAVFGATALLGFLLYSAALPQVFVYMQSVYVDPAAGYAPLSWEFADAVVGGLAAGLRPPWLWVGALVMVLVGGIGFVSVFRRNWPLVAALTLPGVFLAAFLVLRSLVVSPRFFLLMLIVGLMAGVRGIELAALQAARAIRQPPRLALWMATAVVGLLCIASLAALRQYYTVPKQASRSSLEYIEAHRRPDEVVIVIHLAAGGVLYYGPQFGIHQRDQTYYFVRTLKALDEVPHPREKTIVVTTFPRALRLTAPDLAERIERDWKVERTFPATIGDGEISIWRH